MTNSRPGPVSARRSERPGEEQGPPVEVRQGVWHIRSLEVARAILRDRGATAQAGFNAELVLRAPWRPPLLYADGEAHRQQRVKVARFFTPRAVAANYRGLMEQRARDLVAGMADRGVVDLPRVAMRYSVDVAAQVVGLTNSDRAGMNRRLDRFFALEFESPEGAVQTVADRVAQALRSQLPFWSFYLLDVLPATRVRRRTPGDDVISHLIAEGYSNTEILIEVITFAAAGMVTTREFISMATWHLLENPELRNDYLLGDEAGRLAILLEILRLEPVVGHLYRRTTRTIRLNDPRGGELVIPAGAVLDLYVRAANADLGTGDELTLRPGRAMPAGVGSEALSFGDGAHKCPGNSLAIQETDILLQQLFRRDVTILSQPRIAWNDLIAGYEVRDLVLKVR